MHLEPGVLLILFFSIILHEVSHGYIAYLNGDPTAKRMNRLTLNPVSHIDPFGSILLPLVLVIAGSPFLIGWAKPVPFNPFNFRNRRIGLFTVAAAGPLTNLALASFFAWTLSKVGAGMQLSPILLYGVSINVVLALFNLIPIPPLDGSRIVSVLLPVRFQRFFLSLDRLGLVLLIVLLYTGVIHRVLVPLYEWGLAFFGIS